MHDFPRQKLCELINHHGTLVSEDAQYCESLLHNACGDKYKREIFVLVNAIKEGVVKKLLTQPPDLPSDMALDRLAQQLHDNLWLDKMAAQWAVRSWEIALKARATQPSINQPTQKPKIIKVVKSFKQLSPVNPFDYLSLLWWVLVMPQQLQAYRKIFGQEDERRVGNWLISTLIWWPLLVPTLILGLELWPSSTRAWWPEIYLSFSALLVGAWLLTGRLQIKKNVAIGIAILVSASMAVLVSVGVAGIVAGSVTGDVVIGVAMIVASFIIIFASVGLAVVVAGEVAIIVTGIIGVGTAVGVAIGVAILMSDFVVGFVAGSVAGITASLIVDLMTNRVGTIIKNSLKTGTPSLLASLIFSSLIIDHLFLIGLYTLKWYNF
jgi:hypothetical protein